jgi:hypothetical protein
MRNLIERKEYTAELLSYKDKDIIGKILSCGFGFIECACWQGKNRR